MGKKKAKRPKLNRIPIPVGGIAIGTVNDKGNRTPGSFGVPR